MPRNIGDTIPQAYKRNVHGKLKAYVRLPDAVTKEARPYPLGEWGSRESRDRHAQLVAVWTAAGYRLPEAKAAGAILEPKEPADMGDGLTNTSMCAAYWEKHEYSQSHTSNLQICTKALCDGYGTELAASFTPKKLKALRESLMRGHNLSRKTANRYGRYIVAVFAWAAEEELIPGHVAGALRLVKPIKPGTTGARETAEVEPVEDAIVDKTLPHMPPRIKAMVQLQRHTGMRPGEVVRFSMRELDRSDKKIWWFRPKEHKTARFGKKREVPIGPQAQVILRPWLRADGGYLFSPAEAMAELRAERHKKRQTPDSTGHTTAAGAHRKNQVNRKENPDRVPGERYTTDSYDAAIAKACKRAWPLPAELAGFARRRREKLDAWHKRVSSKDRAQVAEWRAAHRWHANQLRHTFGTEARRVGGIEAAQTALGHTKMSTTEIYAKLNLKLAERVAVKIG